MVIRGVALALALALTACEPVPPPRLWIMIDPRIPGGSSTFLAPDSTLTPGVWCAIAEHTATFDFWEVGDTLGWADPVTPGGPYRSLGTVLTSCRADANTP